MFGLPFETLLIMTIIPLAWVIYAAFFWIRSKNWEDEQ